MPEVGELLGISERAARDWAKRHDLPFYGSRPVRLAEADVLARIAVEGRAPRKPPEVAPEVPGSPPEAPGVREPIEARFTTSPAEVERAIEATATRYMTDFAGLYDRIAAELGERYAAEIAAKDAALAAKDQTIATQVDALDGQRATIAELRQRAEAAEAERDRLRAEAAPPSPNEVRTSPLIALPVVPAPAPDPVPHRPLWRRIWRVFIEGD